MESKSSAKHIHPYSIFAQAKIDQATPDNKHSITELTGLNENVLSVIFDYLDDFSLKSRFPKYKQQPQASRNLMDSIRDSGFFWRVNEEQRWNARYLLDKLHQAFDLEKPMEIDINPESVDVGRNTLPGNYRVRELNDRKGMYVSDFWGDISLPSSAVSAILESQFREKVTSSRWKPMEQLTEEDRQKIKELINYSHYHKLCFLPAGIKYLKEIRDECEPSKPSNSERWIWGWVIFVLFATISYLSMAAAFSGKLLGGLDRAFIVSEQVNFSFTILSTLVVALTLFGMCRKYLSAKWWSFLTDSRVRDELNTVIHSLEELQKEVEEYDSALHEAKNSLTR